jgi:hypothetical protein
MIDDDLNHADRAHSELSASATYRWWECPGSVAASRGIARTSNIAADEGTAAHELAQMCLTSGQDCIEYVSRTIPVGDHKFLVDAEMADDVQVYVDEVRRVHHDALPDARWIEQRITLAPMTPPADMFGTADAACYVTGHTTVHFHDLKFGKRHRVEAVGNRQLRYYALGVVLMLADRPEFAAMPPSHVSMTIVQPRQPAAGRDPIRTEVITLEELLAWAEELMAHARAAVQIDARRRAGPWCQYCPDAECAERARHNTAIACAEFGNYDAYTPPAPDTIPAAELGRLLALFPQVEAWMASVRQAAAARAANSDPDLGWKLVESEGKAVWTDEAAAEIELSLVHGVDAHATPAIVSPAQARARVLKAIRPDHKTNKAAEIEAKRLLAPLIHRPKRTALVPVSDTRPALQGGGAEFPALPDETADTE